MDTDILAASKECLYDANLLDEFTQEYNGLSWLDVADASPSEILADAGLVVPGISPVQSVKSSPNETCSSESSSDDDSKNGSRTSSGRKSSQSPFDWNFYNEPTNELKLEDVELFLQKSVPNSTGSNISDPPVSCKNSDKTRPVMAIENGVIKVVRKGNNCEQSFNNATLHNGTVVHHPNSIFKVVNENGVKGEDNVQLVVEKRLPRILRPANISLAKATNVITPKEGTFSVSSTNHNRPICVTDNNGYHAKNSQTRSVVISPSPDIHQTSKQHSIKEGPKSPVLDFSNFTDAEIRAFKKQQRMIKNRESACQSRQKKKEYVTAIEQQLLEAQQEIARLRLENKLLRDQLETNTRSRKLPRLDSSILIHKKNIAVIFAMVFMVSLNWNVLGWNTKSFSGPSETHINSRHLLWSDETVSSDYDSYNRSAEGIDCQNATLNDSFHINQTESIRIVGELKRWIGNGKTLNWTNTPKKQKMYIDEEQITGGLLETYRLFSKLNLENNIIDLPSTKNGKTNRDKSRLKRLRRNLHTDKDMFPDNALYYDRLYKKIRKTDEFNVDDFGEWNALLQALHRRDDTFYVVGVGKGEHLLLPAVNHNVTRPPKMALILPAKSGNDSLMNDHVTLMQIDCSVVNTTLVKLKSNALPESLRKTNSDEKQYNIKSESKQVKRHKLDSSPSDTVYNTSNVAKYIENSLDDADNNKNYLFAQYLSKSRNLKDSATKMDSAKLNGDADKSNI